MTGDMPVHAGPGRWRRKSTVAEAVCWLGTNPAAVAKFAGPGPDGGPAFLPEGRDEAAAQLAGWHGALLWTARSQAWCAVRAGDWVIREPDGSGCYPCEAGLFAATYEPDLEAKTDVVALSRADLEAVLYAARPARFTARDEDALDRVAELLERAQRDEGERR